MPGDSAMTAVANCWLNYDTVLGWLNGAWVAKVAKMQRGGGEGGALVHNIICSRVVELPAPHCRHAPYHYLYKYYY